MVNQNESTLPTAIEFEYSRSTQHRVVFADGVVGGVTPNGLMIHFSFYNESVNVPPKTLHAVTAEANGMRLGEVQNANTGVISFRREIETDVRMTLEGARALHSWLGSVLEKVNAAATGG